MSTDYRLLREIKACDLLDGCLEKYGIREHTHSSETTEHKKCLTDGRNFMWMYINKENGLAVSLTRYGGNTPARILRAIAEEFETEIVSEYEPQYWGFATEEEWHAWHAKMAKDDEDKFYDDVLKYLKGEPNNLIPGRIGMLKAEIAQKIVAENPKLTLPENKRELLDAINRTYDRDRAHIVKLNEDDLAFAKMINTDEDELPKA